MQREVGGVLAGEDDTILLDEIDDELSRELTMLRAEMEKLRSQCGAPPPRSPPSLQIPPLQLPIRDSTVTWVPKQVRPEAGAFDPDPPVSRTSGPLDSKAPRSTKHPEAVKDKRKAFTVARFLGAEVFGMQDYVVNPAKHEKVQNFLAVPGQVERLIVYGCVICLDCFLYMFTFFPIR
jgi:hypothetical protein